MAAPILEKPNQPPAGNVRRNQKLGNVADAHAAENGVDHEGPIVQDEGAVDR